MPTGRSGSRRRPARATVALTFLNRTPGAARKSSRAVREAGARRTERLLHDAEGRLPSQRRDQRPVRRHRRRQTRRAASGIFVVPPVEGGRRSRLRRRRFSRRWPAARSGGPVTDARSRRRCSRSTRKDASERRLRARHRARGRRAAREPGVSLSRRARARRPACKPGATGALYRISDLELASRLSFFLWSSIPDDELLDVAASGKLAEPGGARAAGAPDAGRSARGCAGDELRGAVAVPAESSDGAARIRRREPDFDEDLRQGFRRETELFAGSILREDRSVLDLLTADYTFVNERLAKHYGIPNVRGTHFRRVDADRRRPPRPAGPGQRAGGHVVSESDVARRARQVDSRESARHAAAAAAAGRAGARGEAEARQKKSSVDARAHRRSIAPTPCARAATR